jgi:hypothetical protein
VKHNPSCILQFITQFWKLKSAKEKKKQKKLLLLILKVNFLKYHFNQKISFGVNKENGAKKAFKNK